MGKQHIDDNEDKAWKDLGAKNFLSGYGDDEPDYDDVYISEEQKEMVRERIRTAKPEDFMDFDKALDQIMSGLKKIDPKD